MLFRTLSRTALGGLALLLLLVFGNAASSGASPAPFVLKIGASGNYGVMPYAQAHGTFAKGLASLGVTVQWVPIAGAYSTTLAALQSGAINLEDAPMSGSVATINNNLPVKVFTMTHKAYTYPSSGIIVPKNSPIKSVKDLVGQSVVVNPAAKGEYVLLLALQEAGIPFSKVKRVYVQPPVAAPAFASGSIAAWSTFSTFFDSGVADGGRVIVREDSLHSDDLLTAFVGNTQDLKAHPAVFKKFVQLYDGLAAQARKDPAKFMNVLQTSGPTVVTGASYTEDLNITRETYPLYLPSAVDDAPITAISNIFFKGGVIQAKVKPSQLLFNFSG